MLTLLMVYITINLKCVSVQCQLQSSSNMGSYFLVQAPHAVGGNVKLILYTMSAEPINVTVTVPGLPEPYEKMVNIHRPKLGSADMPPNFTSDQPGFIWTAVIRSTGGAPFGVAVYIPNKEGAVAVMVAIPVASFGQLYYVVTLDTGAFVSVMAPNKETEVTIEVNNPSLEFNVVSNTQTFSHGTTNSFYLLEEQAFILQAPGCKKTSHGGLTGTRVSADKPVGVITGNCMTKSSNITCDASSDVFDMTLEMLASVESYGKRFILLDIDSLSPGYVVIIASTANTTVNIYHDDFDVQTFVLTLLEPGNFVMEQGPVRYSRLLKASAPVACYYIGVTPCRGVSTGGPFISVVVPNELFLNAYLLRFPKSQKFKFDVSVLFVCRKTSITNIRLNDEILPTHTRWVVVSGLLDWRVGHLRHNTNRLDSFSSNGINYGLYTYGIQRGYAFMTPVGYLVAPINSLCEPTNNVVVPGDQLDNDCDGFIDEEVKNSLDDDLDGLIDEDLASAPSVRGNWGPWSRWTCPKKCEMQRQRQCNNPAPQNDGAPCIGPDFQNSTENCPPGTICPLDCPPKRYLIDCVGKCPHCESDCHKFTGKCYKCLAGWRFPSKGCNESCPPMTFGLDCKGHCDIKCGADCMERVHGFCPELSSSKDALFLLLFVIMFLPFMCFPCVLHLNIPCVPGTATQKKMPNRFPNPFTTTEPLKSKEKGSDTSLGKFVRKGSPPAGRGSRETLV